jgi:hypothetical protein
VAEYDDKPTEFPGPDPLPDVAIGDGPSGPYAYHPRRLLVLADEGVSQAEMQRVVKRIQALLEELAAGDSRVTLRSDFVILEFATPQDIPRLVEALRSAGYVATPDIAYVVASLTATPMSFSGAMLANPMSFSGLYYSAPMSFSGELVTDPMSFSRRSTARPYASPRLPVAHRLLAGVGKPQVGVIDTGYLEVPPGESDTGIWKLPSGDLIELPDPDDNLVLDPAAGHNGFIQGIVLAGAPKTSLRGLGPIRNDGVGYESDIADALDRFHADWDAAGMCARTLLNLSFSGYYENDTPPPILARRIRRLVGAGVVVVASAGNDATCRPAFPAAMSEVIGVGSVGPCGPSWFSNHGSWVDASAPGEDVVSIFFDKWNGGFDPPPGTDLPDPDDFKGFAMWSGTSFAAPRVVAAIARQIQLRNCTALDAVELVLGRPGLFRLPDYGVIVNQGF